MFSLFLFNGKKTKDGRSTGLGVQEDDSFLWDQGNLYAGGPHAFLKAEWNRTFSPQFFLSAKYSYNNTGGFFLHPRGGDINGTVDFDNGVAHGAYATVDNTRPAHTANLDMNYYKAATGGGHEFKFGFGYRKFNVTSTTHWGGNQLFSYIAGGTGYVHVKRDARNATQAAYWSAYAGDTFTKGRMTLNLGVRWDRQSSKNLPSQVPGNASFPNILGPVDLRRKHGAARVERLLSAGRADRRPRRVAQDRAARILRPLRQPAPLGPGVVPGAHAVPRGLLRLSLGRQQP